MIRVGMIGCNRRALWYAALMNELVPEEYAALAPASYHHMTYYQHVELQVAYARGMRVTKIYDPDARAAERIAAAFRKRPTVAASIHEVNEDVDAVLVANEDGDGSAHPALAAPGLRGGVPTFVDRPLAATVKEARAMLRLAQRNKAPLLSCSHTRMLPHAARFRARFEELGHVERGFVCGHGAQPAQIADAVELALSLFAEGFGRPVSVCSMGAQPCEVMLLECAAARGGAKRQVLIDNTPHETPRNAIWAKAMGAGPPLDSPAFDAFLQPEGGVAVPKALREMVRTGRSPMSPARLIEPTAVIEAARHAHNAPRAVPVPNAR